MNAKALMFGAVLGAAATMYAFRKRPDVMMAAGNAVCDMGTSIMNKSIKGMKRMNMKQGVSGKFPKPSDETVEKFAAGWEQAKGMMSKVPELKREVTKIITESSELSH